jgi:hypothetical protein
MSAPLAPLLDLARGTRPTAVGNENALIDSALEHRMLGSVAAAHRRGELGLSAETGTRIAMIELKERHRHRRFWESVAEIETRLEPIRAHVAVLKGIATEARWYDELGERVCTDVDLLVSPRDLERVGEVIAAIDPTRDHVDLIHRLVAERVLQHVDLRLDDVQIDLHFDPFKVGLPARTLDDLWSRTERIVTHHGAITVLDAESELVLLLLHLNKDRFAMLGPMLDVRNLVDRADIDWERLADIVGREGLEVPVWCSLATVVDTLGLDIEVPRPRGLRAWTWRRLWSDTLGGYHGRESAPTRQRLMTLHARGRGADQLRELRRQLLPHRGLLEVAGRLGSDDAYLSYLARRIGRSPLEPERPEGSLSTSRPRDGR